MNVVRALSSEGNGRIKYFSQVRELLSSDVSFRAYFEGETSRLPEFFRSRIKKDLGPLWEYLPRGALKHDHYAYLRSQPMTGQPLIELKVAQA
jgi:hypothetical protein